MPRDANLARGHGGKRVRTSLHDRIEAIAGAIALGEATDEERREYREHIAKCRRCLSALGGEREIERVASTVVAARESEIWQPPVKDLIAMRTQRRHRTFAYGMTLAAFVIAVSLAGQVLASRNVSKPLAPLQATVAVAPTARTASAGTKTISPPKAVPLQRRMIVQHNVVQITRAPIAAAPISVPETANTKPQEIAAITVHAPPRQTTPKNVHSDVPIWRRGDAAAWHTVATTTTTSLSESAPQAFTHRAESIQVLVPHVTRDAAPIGGETAINPQPPMIAYDEGAEGTSAFEVLIDERGTATRCVITKSAGYTVLDATVCKAAMQARYTPKTIDGRAVPGVYRDAFTFRMSNNQAIEGIPKVIPQ
jgi:TonB family protein